MTVAEILGPDCLDAKTAQQSRQDQSRVVDVLTALGWHQPAKRPLVDGKRARVYVRRTEPAKPIPLTAAEELTRKALLTGGVDGDLGRHHRSTLVAPARSCEAQACR